MTAAGPLNNDSFVNAYDEVDSLINRIKGLAIALDDLMDALPILCSDDPRAQGIRAIALSIGDHATAAKREHQTEWDVLKGEPARAA